LFRKLLDQEYTHERLSKFGVQLLSHSEDLSGEGGEMMRQFLGLVNQAQVREIRRNTIRAMKRNAELGYSNGGHTPFGYRAVTVEQMGDKDKRRLAIEPAEASIVRVIFGLAIHGDGNSGPMGTHAIALWLNRKGYQTRAGNIFGTGTVHEILTREAYVGLRRYNEFDSTSGLAKPQSEVRHYEVPIIIEREQFEVVQSLLKSRAPRLKGPRLESSPSLLGGLIRCSCEDSAALTASTGTSRTGKIYTYYKCIQAKKQSRDKLECASTCKRVTLPRPPTDALVEQALLDHLLQPERVADILAHIQKQRAERNVSAERRLTNLVSELLDVRQRLQRLLDSVELGVLDPRDPEVKPRLESLRETRDRLQESLDYATKTQQAGVSFDPIAVQKFIAEARKRLTEGDVALRKAILSALVDHIVVDGKTIYLIGENDNIPSALAGKPKRKPSKKVRISVQEWCP
jgi:site-specific DNA recombinase